MAKKNMFQRELNKKRLIKKYIEKRKDILNKLKFALIIEEKLNLNKKLQKFPVNSSNIRLRNRCTISGKPRGIFRFFGLSRNLIREYGHKSLLPGIIKASW
jgi:small subunit ribosomal protein S14